MNSREKAIQYIDAMKGLGTTGKERYLTAKLDEHAAEAVKDY